MPPRKRPGRKEPLYTSVRLSWPPCKLQFQFDHTRRVVDARSRIDAIDLRYGSQTGPVESEHGPRDKSMSRAYNMNYTIIHIYLISIHKNDFQLQRHHLQSKQVDATSLFSLLLLLAEVESRMRTHDGISPPPPQGSRDTRKEFATL